MVELGEIVIMVELAALVVPAVLVVMDRVGVVTVVEEEMALTREMVEQVAQETQIAIRAPLEVELLVFRFSLAFPRYSREGFFFNTPALKLRPSRRNLRSKFVPTSSPSPADCGLSKVVYSKGSDSHASSSARTLGGAAGMLGRLNCSSAADDPFAQ